jgi:predicted metal-dependent hydrolase
LNLHGNPEEQSLMADPRLGVAIGLFNAADWYACHDLLEELWHETAGPMRPVLQGILQISVAELHLEKANLRGATILMGEGLGRLRSSGSMALGLDLDGLRVVSLERLQTLRSGGCLDRVPFPKLIDGQVANQERFGGAL